MFEGTLDSENDSVHCWKNLKYEEKNIYINIIKIKIIVISILMSED